MEIIKQILNELIDTSNRVLKNMGVGDEDIEEYEEKEEE